jgi:hypothetical protein
MIETCVHPGICFKGPDGATLIHANTQCFLNTTLKEPHVPGVGVEKDVPYN